MLAEQPELRVLRLWGIDVGDGVKHLGKMTRLENLELCQTKASDGRLDFLAGLTGLRRLRLDGFPLDPKSLGALAKLEKLELLYLDETPFDDGGAAAIRGLVELRYLSLNSTRVTDAGTAHWGKLVKLELLGLNKTAVTDKTLEVVKDATELNSLGLNGTKVTGSGFEHLGRMSKLFNFGIANTPLDAEELIKNAKNVSGSGEVMIFTYGTKMTPDQMKRYVDLQQFSEFFPPEGKYISRRPPPPPAK